MTAAVVAGVVISAGPGIAATPDNGESVDAVVDALDNSAPYLGAVSELSMGSDQALTATTAAGVDVTVDSETVTVDNGSADPITITLPRNLSVADPAVTSEGEAVLASTRSGAASAAVQVLDSGSVSVQTVLHSSDAPSSYSYTIEDGLTPTLRDDGGVDLVGSEGAVEGEIDIPWAYDADGNSIPTSYEVSGSAVIQSVAVTDDTVFPVVADPSFGHTYGIPTLYLSKAETTSASQDMGNVQVLCAAGGLLSGVLALFCSGNAQIISNSAKQAVRDNKCTKIVLGIVVAAPSYTGGYCS